MAFQVSLTPEAEADLNDILDGLLLRGAETAALRWYQRLREAIDSLAHNPHRCALAPESRSAQSEVRQLLYGRKPHIYRILFTTGIDAVNVLRVRHGRSQPLYGQ